MASKTVTRKPPRTRVTRAKEMPSADELADKLASGLKITDSTRTLKQTVIVKTKAGPSAVKGKSKVKKDETVTLEEQKASAMRRVNTALQSLSSLVQSKWSVTANTTTGKTARTRHTVASVTATGESTRMELITLRGIAPGIVDVERAASSLLGKLVALELFEKAVEVLHDTHDALVVLCNSEMQQTVRSLQSRSSQASIPNICLNILSIPMPPLPNALDPIIPSLVCSYFSHALTIASHFIGPQHSLHVSFLDSFTESGTALAWTDTLTSLPQKTLDSMLKRAYMTLTASFQSSSTPSILVRIRFCALKFLVHTSDLNPTTFWDQVSKVSGAYIKAEHIQNEEDKARQILLDCLRDIVTEAEDRGDDGKFMTGRGWVSFCEFWLSLLNKTGDLDTLNSISRYILNSASPSSAGPEADPDRTVVIDSQDDNFEGAKITAVWAQTAALLEHYASSQSEPQIADVLDSMSMSRSALEKYRHLFLASELAENVCTKARRSMEKLRRAAVKAFGGGISSFDVRQGVITLLESIIDTSYHILQCSAMSSAIAVEVTVSAFDSLFNLGTHTLVISDMDTYGKSYDYLAQAFRFLDSKTLPEAVADASDERSSKESEADYVRCISGAFFNLACTLYKAGKYSPAVLFLKQACPLADRALQLHDDAFCDKLSTTSIEKDPPKNAEAWLQLRTQLYRRWELLAVCYSKTDARRLAYEAFIEGLKRYSFRDALESLVRTCQSCDVFNSPSYQQLGAMVDRITYLGAAELFLHKDASLFKPLQSAAVPALCIGAVLEKQIDGLDASKWKPEIQEVIRHLLDDLLLVYDSKYPIRRARVMIRLLEHAYFTGSIGLFPEELGEDIQGLLSGESLGNDTSLATFRCQYLASTHLWLALHAHRQTHTRTSVGMVQHATETLKTLRMMVAQPQSPTAKKSPSQNNTGVMHGNAMQKATAPPARGKTRVIKQTPPRPKPVNVSTPQRTQGLLLEMRPAVDDFDGFVTQLRTLTRLVGLLGYVLLKVELLTCIRRLCEQQRGITSEAYIRASVDLAHELVKVGKTRKGIAIYRQVTAAIRQGQSDVNDTLIIHLLLRHAESLAILGDAAKGLELYTEAAKMTEQLPLEDKTLSTSARIHARVAVLQRTALAATVFAAIQYAYDDPMSSMEHLLQALRLFNRATETLARLNPQSTREPTDDNPFDMTSVKDALNSKDSSQNALEAAPLRAKSIQHKPTMDGVEWEITDGLLHTLLTLSRAYFTRGSPREAEYFAQQAQVLAESVQVPAMISRSLARKSEVQLHLGQVEEALENLTKAFEWLENVPGTDAAEIRRLKGDYSHMLEQATDACTLYEDASSVLRDLDSRFAALETLSAGSPRKSLMTSPKSAVAIPKTDPIASTIIAAILSQHIWLLRDEVGEEYDKLLEYFLSLPSSSDVQAEQNALLGKLALHEILGRFHGDMFLSSLAESTIAIPAGMTADKAGTLTGSTQEIMVALRQAENLLSSGLETFFRRGQASYIRQAAMSLALIRAFQTSLGKSGRHGPNVVANLLDLASSLTLRRELLEIAKQKYTHFPSCDDAWPSARTNGSSEALMQSTKLPGLDFMEMNNIDGPDDEHSTRCYWDFIQKKYGSQMSNSSNLLASEVNHLPDNWMVINISVTDDKSTLLVSRRRPRREPLIFCISLKGRRDNEDGEHFTFDDGLQELKEILQLSDEGTRQAIEIKKNDREGKAAWWAERKRLDMRLKELLDNIEFCWLGAFKTVFSKPTKMPPDVIPALRTRLEKVLKDNLGSHEKKLKAKLKLDNSLLESFSSLPSDCRDEELEDLVYFILDLYHFQGVPIALAEVDIDQFAVDLKTALEEHHVKVKGRVIPEPDDHLFLVLDKNVQGIPWESIPILRGRSVSRVPSASFLVDSLELAKARSGFNSVSRLECGPGSSSPPDRFVIDPTNAYFVLNPGGDLSATEGRFADWAKGMKRVGWEGIVGQQPSEQQMLNALEHKDLVIYFGHGGAEQYVRSHKIRHLPRCAVTMLWGCSSGTLREMGAFDRVGTPYNYILAGCPTLVANLWDVTDRDIDIYTQAVFNKLRLEPECVKRRRGAGESGREGETSVIAAVAQSRNSCKLKYLTGAATVVYGIPFYL